MSSSSKESKGSVSSADRRPGDGPCEVESIGSEGGQASSKKRWAHKHDSGPKAPAITTLMILSIPSSFTRQDLMDELDLLGFGDTYDFIFIPPNSPRSVAFDHYHAIVNFMGKAVAKKAHFALDGHTLSAGGGVITVRPAKLQGLTANLCQFNRKVAYDPSYASFRPWLRAPK